MTGVRARTGAAAWTLDPKRNDDCKEKGASTLTDDPVRIGARNQAGMIRNACDHELSFFDRKIAA